jgi:hypothetical protein
MTTAFGRVFPLPSGPLTGVNVRKAAVRAYILTD